MRYRLSAAGAAGVVAVLVISWAVWGHVGSGNGSGELALAGQAAAQNGIASQPPACADSGLGDRLGMANPAATYCKELGYEYRITQNNKGEEGICVFPEAQGQGRRTCRRIQVAGH